MIKEGWIIGLSGTVRSALAGISAFAVQACTFFRNWVATLAGALLAFAVCPTLAVSGAGAATASTTFLLGFNSFHLNKIII